MPESATPQEVVRRRKIIKSVRSFTGNSTDVGAITRSTIWFDDGSIILQAGQTQFRVHKSVLSRNSSVFGDMFAVPQPENEPIVDGCAIVHVTDEPEDWKNIFEILYDNVKAYKSTDAISFSLLASMLRLGRKYEFSHLQQEALQRLKQSLPRTLEEWDKTYDESGSRNELAYDTFDLINLLVEVGIESVLPIAYCAFLDEYKLTAVIKGTVRDDGRPVGIVAPQAMSSLLLGHEALSRAISHAVEWVDDDVESRCRHRNKCHTRRVKVLKTVVKYWRVARLFSPSKWNNLHSPPLCYICAARMRARVQATRQDMWDKLPTYFGLPEWKDLEDD